MKKIKLFFVLCSFSIFSFGSCEEGTLEAGIQDLPKCTDLTDDLIVLKKADNQEAIIDIYESEYKGLKDTVYLIKDKNVPTGYLKACNLPEEFKQEGLRIRFSGTVYISKDNDKMNLAWIPVELASIQQTISK